MLLGRRLRRWRLRLAVTAVICITAVMLVTRNLREIESNKNSPDSTANLVLISSYKRSGSTFLGRVVGWNEESFYWYEPLMSRYIHEYINEDGAICDYYSPTCRQFDSSNSSNKRLASMMRFISDIYQCHFASYYEWIDTFKHLHASKDRVDSANLVLISSYKRSGSTFLGRVVGWNEESFYWYEPLMSRYIHEYIHEDGAICDYNSTQCRRNAASDKTLEAMLTFLEDIYYCNFANYYDWVEKYQYLHASIDRVGHSWELFRNCTDPLQHRCLRRLVPVCMSAKHRLIKLLRMELQLSSKLLTVLPNLKIVHLFRDPRGQVNSHVHTKWYKVKEDNQTAVEADTQALCSRMRNDIKTAKRLLIEFPDRFRVVQYEDLDDPVYKSKLLYDFIGMGFNARTTELIDTLQDDGGDAGFHPFSYRDTLKWETVVIVNKHCSDIYAELGYVNFQTDADFKNASISPLLGALPYSL